MTPSVRLDCKVHFGTWWERRLRRAYYQEQTDFCTDSSCFASPARFSRDNPLLKPSTQLLKLHSLPSSGMHCWFRPRRMPERLLGWMCCVSWTSQPLHLWHMVWRRRTTRPFWCLTWEVAPLTSPFWRLVMVCAKCWPHTVTLTWVVTTLTRSLSTGWLRTFRRLRQGSCHGAMCFKLRTSKNGLWKVHRSRRVSQGFCSKPRSERVSCYRACGHFSVAQLHKFCPKFVTLRASTSWRTGKHCSVWRRQLRRLRWSFQACKRPGRLMIHMLPHVLWNNDVWDCKKRL